MRIYWICSQIKKLHENKTHLLKKEEIDVSFFINTQDMLKSYETKRVSTILIDSSVISKNNINYIHKFINLPSIKSCRFIFTYEIYDLNLIDISSFSDILPFSLESDEWIYRVKYSSARKPYIFKNDKALFQLENKITAHIPVKIKWISYDKICFESHFMPEKKDLLNLNGNFTKILELDIISIQVLNIKDNYLNFRFSNEITAKFTSNTFISSRLLPLADKLSFTNKPPASIFIIAKSNKIRKKILEDLSNQNYNIHIALNKNNVCQDPKYICPDIIIIENQFCIDNEDLFKNLIQNTTEKTLILIIGDYERIYNLDIDIKKLKIKITKLEELKYIINNFNKNYNHQNKYYYFNDNNINSTAYVLLNFNLLSINPIGARFYSKYLIKKFSLIKSNSDFISKNIFHKDIYLKITDNYKNPKSNNFKYIIDTIFLNINTYERNEGALNLLKEYKYQISDFIIKDDKKNKKTPKHNIKSTNTQNNFRIIFNFIEITIVISFIIYIIVNMLLPQIKNPGEMFNKSLESYKKSINKN